MLWPMVSTFRVNFRTDLSITLQYIVNIMKRNMGSGVPLSEIYGARSSWNTPEFPLVLPSFQHTVLYHVSSDGSFVGDRPPKPQIGQDKWDHDYVRMPCSSKSLYPVENDSGETFLKKRWMLIEKALTQPINNSEQLAAAILSYNTNFKNIWKFRALHTLLNEYLEEEESQYFFDVTLPQIAKLALDLPKLIQSPIPLLKQHKNKSISLSQQQISSLLANSFFCTFPRRNTTKKSSEYETYPYINFNKLYECGGESTLEKLKCICHYFKRICTKVPVGVVTFSRRSVPPAKCPQWIQSEASVATLPVHVDSDTTIEDAHGLIQVDFANKYLGGGVIGHGCVQEEIRFVICPELMISMLFTEVLRPNEALMIIGCERYSSYIGYGNSFQWAGNYEDQTPRDSSGRRRTAVLAIDALPYGSIIHEYKREFITRELNKAWVGFTFYSDDSSQGFQYPGIATGNWGCGAFGGSPALKSLIQIMACTQAKRPMAYYTFGDTQLKDDIINLTNLLAKYNVTVGQLYKYIMKFTTLDVRKIHLHEFLQQTITNNGKIEPTVIPGSSSKNLAVETNTLVTKSDEKQHTTEPALQNSPDLFSQDESISSQVSEEYCNMTIEENNTSLLISKERESDMSLEENKTKELSTVQKASENKFSRLVDVMEKLDEGSGLNLSSKKNDAVSEKMDCDEKSHTEPTAKIKSKIAKITDYFSKTSS